MQCLLRLAYNKLSLSLSLFPFMYIRLITYFIFICLSLSCFSLIFNNKTAFPHVFKYNLLLLCKVMSLIDRKWVGVSFSLSLFVFDICNGCTIKHRECIRHFTGKCIYQKSKYNDFLGFFSYNYYMRLCYFVIKNNKDPHFLFTIPGSIHLCLVAAGYRNLSVATVF